MLLSSYPIRCGFGFLNNKCLCEGTRVRPLFVPETLPLLSSSLKNHLLSVGPVTLGRLNQDWFLLLKLDLLIVAFPGSFNEPILEKPHIWLKCPSPIGTPNSPSRKADILLIVVWFSLSNFFSFFSSQRVHKPPSLF